MERKMAEPIDPLHPSKSHEKLPPKLSPKDLPKESAISARAAFEHKTIDPASVWSKFLSFHGTQEVTEQDVKMFIQGLEKMLQITVQQNARAAKRAMDKLKESGQ